MSKHRELSAKDLAFEKERGDFRRRIKELQFTNELRSEYVETLELCISNLECENQKLEDWNRRLLEFIDMEPDVFKSLLTREKEFKKFDQGLSMIQSLLNKWPI